jgi:hypothetical protein
MKKSIFSIYFFLCVCFSQLAYVGVIIRPFATERAYAAKVAPTIQVPSRAARLQSSRPEIVTSLLIEVQWVLELWRRILRQVRGHLSAA